jgi:peptidoglycan/xylan/chitin deacetylase (PgdA/CDA1 family)
MKTLKRYSIPISLKTRNLMERGKRYSMVTFDDGFRSVLKNGLPIMEELDISSIHFIPSGYLGKKPGWKAKTGKIPESEEVISSDELVEFSKNSLIEIGSHSINHANFSKLTYEEIEKELVDSKKHLEKLISVSVDTFSFPYGVYTRESLEICKKAGYELIFTIEPDITTFSENEYSIGRVSIDLHHWNLEFFLKIQGAYRWLPVGFALKKQLIKLIKGKSQN